MPKIFYIDLFSGAGGTTTGIHLANNKNIEVVACVNHDAKAIESHKKNHQNCLHLIEDVRDYKVILVLKSLVEKLRKEHPCCIIIIWASLECTNFSKAKGGKPREADSRTLAYTLYNYIDELDPDYVMVENVREFMAWGPLDENGKPISRLNGRDYLRWIKQINSMGYDYDKNMLNSADFGAYTSRERYFGQFAKKGLPINWPETTHVKKQKQGLFEDKKKWMAVKDVLDLEDEGESIFTRKKPLVENTLKRIYAGLIKFVAGGEDQFIKKYYSGIPSGKVISLNGPAGTIKTVDGQAVVFTLRYNGGNPKEKVKSIENPIGAITTQGRRAVVRAHFLHEYHGNGTPKCLNNPCPVLPTKDRYSIIDAQFIDQQYGTGKAASINNPINTLTAVPKFNLVQTKSFLYNPAWGGTNQSINKPSPVIVARQDKAPLYIIQTIEGNYSIIVYESDSETMKQIKEFMALYGIIDIRMRMLKIIEMLRIQGFPEDYILIGNQADQKKQIGNAVVPLVAQKICEANANAINNHLKNVA